MVARRDLGAGVPFQRVLRKLAGIGLQRGKSRAPLVRQARDVEHRSVDGPTLGLENTTAAFTHAVELGYRYLETDVHVTRDGVLLAFHDEVLDRVTDRVGSVADLTYAEIRGARLAGREEIPTLPQLLDAFPEAPHTKVTVTEETPLGRLEDEDYPAYTMGRAAEIIGASPDFLRRLGEAKLIDPFRSPGGHRRYSRYQLRLAARAKEMVDEGTALEAACRIIILQDQLEEALRVNESLRKSENSNAE